MGELNRRDFVIGATAVCTGICLTCGLAEAEPTTQASASSGTVAAGNIKDYPKNSLSDKYKKDGFFLSHQEDELFALSVKCTHKNVVLDINPEKTGFHCKAHKSDFSDHGTVVKGPAQRSLTRYAISKDAKGNLTVDKGQSFSEKEWENPASFVKMS